jgi:hypothetical protein
MPEDNALHNHSCENLKSNKKGVLGINDDNIPKNAMNMKLKGKHPTGRQR